MLKNKSYVTPLFDLDFIKDGSSVNIISNQQVLPLQDLALGVPEGNEIPALVQQAVCFAQLPVVAGQVELTALTCSRLKSKAIGREPTRTHMKVDDVIYLSASPELLNHGANCIKAAQLGDTFFTPYAICTNKPYHMHFTLFSWTRWAWFWS